MAFTKALIPVENKQPFEALRQAIAQALSTGSVEGFLKKLEKSNIRVREWEKALAAGVFGAEAQANYKALTPAEQGMVRENYLASIEEVDMKLRAKFKKLYGYY